MIVINDMIIRTTFNLPVLTTIQDQQSKWLLKMELMTCFVLHDKAIKDLQSTQFISSKLSVRPNRASCVLLENFVSYCIATYVACPLECHT